MYHANAIASDRVTQKGLMLKGAFTSPKIRVFAARVGVPFPHALGMCGMLWNFVADHAPCGDIGRHDDSSIAIALEWPNDPAALVNALVAARLLDVHPKHRLVVHDWADHCPQYVRAKVARMGMSLVRTSVPTNVVTSVKTESALEPALEGTSYASASTSTHTSSSSYTPRSGKGRGGGGGGDSIGGIPESTDPNATYYIRKLTEIVGATEAVRLAKLIVTWPKDRRYDRFKAILQDAAGKKSPKAWLIRVIENEGVTT